MGRAGTSWFPQIALSWLMVQKPWIVPISGTTRMTHMVDKVGAAAIRFTPDEVAELNATSIKPDSRGMLPSLRAGLIRVEAPAKR
jgi:aryl-alcohol dehydrogenase-like predicted oxidoreductase